MHLASSPLCVMCDAEGKIKQAHIVDHITPRRAGGSDTSFNLMSLCERHHQLKTAEEGGATDTIRNF